MKPIILLFLVIALTACRQNPKNNYRDTVLSKFIQMADSSGRYDSTEKEYRLLKAYLKNDVTTLQQIDRMIEDEMNKRPNWKLWNSDLPVPRMNELNAREAYRFVFSVNDGSDYECITLAHQDSIIDLHYLYFQRNRVFPKFSTITEFNRPISTEQWNEVANALDDTDFEGMKNDKEHRGKDGNDLTVISYRKTGDGEFSHLVHRWAPETPLAAAFQKVYSGILTKEERAYLK